MARDLYIRPREVEILRQALADGMTTREAAEHMGRSLATVVRLMRKHKLASSHIQIGRQRKAADGSVWVTTKLGAAPKQNPGRSRG